MVFLRPIILRDAATEAAVSNEKYNFLRAQQLKMRENRELKFRDQQPVLPELPPMDTDVRVPRAQDAQERPQDLMREPPPLGARRARTGGAGRIRGRDRLRIGRAA
jgi:hypothetical protein